MKPEEETELYNTRIAFDRLRVFCGAQKDRIEMLEAENEALREFAAKLAASCGGARL